MPFTYYINPDYTTDASEAPYHRFFVISKSEATRNLNDFTFLRFLPEVEMTKTVLCKTIFSIAQSSIKTWFLARCRRWSLFHPPRRRERVKQEKL
jgi:hypothetical protein